MKKIATVLALGLSTLFALPAQAETPKSTPVTLTDAQLATVKEAVADMLKDPESARFSGIEARETSHIIAVCGWINAKNSYGGYVGKNPFIVKLFGHNNKAMMSGSIIDDEQSSKAYEACSGWGIHLTD